MKIQQFSIYDAVDYGIESAVILAILRCLIPLDSDVHKHTDGFSYQFARCPTERLREHLPYMWRSTITRKLYELERKGAIMSSTLWNDAFDKTKSYTMPEFRLEQH